MTLYDIRELPNIDNPNLIRSCVAAQQMRGTLSELVQHIVAQLDFEAICLGVVDRLKGAKIEFCHEITYSA